MTQLSVIIVNYNVRHFLEQCLHAVRKACAGMSAEIFVVDNNSVDGSVEMIREKFPEVLLIANTVNTGFAVANNQALKVAKGKYCLLLNPDTIVEEDTFSKCFAFCESHPDAGGLGVYMIDGSGKFLPESKRGLPTPFVAFCKITGLSALFPRSRTFGRYHLGFLNKNETHKVDVLSGAFMWMRKETLEKVGLLDEDFFMYGEDIDLSYRITQGGFSNYYFPATRIIHYKGESTKKSSVNYVIVFYKAMIIFARKHFSSQNARLFSLLIHLAVYMRALLALVNRLGKQVMLPLLDTLVSLAGIMILKFYWESSVKELNYPPLFVQVVIPAYMLVWIIGIYFSGGYDKPLRIFKAVRGVVSGTIFILVVYALLSEEYRFSRALTVLGAVWAGFAVAINRFLLGQTRIHDFRLERSEKKNLLIVGNEEEGMRILNLIRSSGQPFNFVGFAGTGNAIVNSTQYKSQYLGGVNELPEMTSVYQVNEIVFCAKDISSQDTIECMLRLRTDNTEYKIAPPESLFIIGSNSDDTQGDLYLVDINRLDSPAGRRGKRFFDLLSSLGLLITLPINIWMVREKGNYIGNIFKVLIGAATWVAPEIRGIQTTKGNRKPGIIRPSEFAGDVSEAVRLRIDSLYMRDYHPSRDLKILFKSFPLLGN